MSGKGAGKADLEIYEFIPSNMNLSAFTVQKSSLIKCWSNPLVCKYNSRYLRLELMPKRLTIKSFVKIKKNLFLQAN